MIADPFADSSTADLRRETRNLLDSTVAPRVTAFDRDGVLPADAIRDIAPILGRAESATAVEWATIMEEVGRVDGALRTFVTVQCDLVIRTLAAHGDDDQRQKWLPGLRAGTAIGAFGLTEPDAGSDAASLTSRAEPFGDRARLFGAKSWLTNGNQAQIAIIFARSFAPRDGRGISAYLVEPGDGWHAERIPGMLGMRALDCAEVTLDGAPADSLGADGAGWRIAMGTVDAGRLSVAAGSVGLAQAAFEAASAYAHQRQQFGKPVAAFQLVQELVADIVVDLVAARELVLRAARLRDAGTATVADIALAKLFATEAAERCANRALQVHGSHGYSAKYPVERYLRDARGATLYQGTSQIQKLILGRDALGVNAIG